MNIQPVQDSPDNKGNNTTANNIAAIVSNTFTVVENQVSQCASLTWLILSQKKVSQQS